MDKTTENLKRFEAVLDGLSRAVRSAREHLGAGLQLTRTQLEILMMLSHKPAQTTGELAAALFLTQSAVTQTINTLYRRGLLERHSDDRDRRITRLKLSPAGHEITDRLRTIKRDNLRSLVSRLTDDEINAMITAAEKFTVLLEEKAS